MNFNTRIMLFLCLLLSLSLTSFVKRRIEIPPPLFLDINLFIVLLPSYHVLNVINNLQIYIYNINNITLIKLLRNLDMF